MRRATSDLGPGGLGLLLGDRDRPRVGVCPSGAVGGPGWCEAGGNRRPPRKAWKPWFACHCQAHRVFLVTFKASEEGRKELVGLRRVRVGGAPGSWAVLRSQVPCPGERLRDVGGGG